MTDPLPAAPLKLARFVKFREEKFGAVLFETQKEKVFTLNATGAAVVRAIVSGSSDVVGALRAQFDDDSGVLAAEVAAFITALAQQGLLSADQPDRSPATAS